MRRWPNLSAWQVSAIERTQRALRNGSINFPLNSNNFQIEHYVFLCRIWTVTLVTIVRPLVARIASAAVQMAIITDMETYVVANQWVSKTDNSNLILNPNLFLTVFSYFQKKTMLASLMRTVKNLAPPQLA